MSEATQFLQWCKERVGHPPNVRKAIVAINELQAEIEQLKRERDIRYLRQQAKGIDSAVGKVDTHKPFRPIKAYDGDIKINADLWKKSYKKGYGDALAEIKYESVKLNKQADELERA